MVFVMLGLGFVVHEPAHLSCTFLPYEPSMYCTAAYYSMTVHVHVCARALFFLYVNDIHWRRLNSILVLRSMTLSLIVLVAKGLVNFAQIELTRWTDVHYDAENSLV